MTSLYLASAALTTLAERLKVTCVWTGKASAEVVTLTLTSTLTLDVSFEKWIEVGEGVILTVTSVCGDLWIHVVVAQESWTGTYV